VADARSDMPPQARRLGRMVNGVIARAPFLWPLLRSPIRRFFDQRADGWDQRTGAGSVDHLAALATATASISPSIAPERALDLGTGTGEAALFLAREYPRASVRGVDISTEMVRAARDKVGLDPEGRIAFKVADAADLPYPDRHFDLVTQVNMPPFFAETARVLSPGGHVIVVASLGSSTPFFTAPGVLERGFRRHGLEPVGDGSAGAGTYFIARAGRG